MVIYIFVVSDKEVILKRYKQYRNILYYFNLKLQSWKKINNTNDCHLRL